MATAAQQLGGAARPGQVRNWLVVRLDSIAAEQGTRDPLDPAQRFVQGQPAREQPGKRIGQRGVETETDIRNLLVRESW